MDRFSTGTAPTQHGVEQGQTEKENGKEHGKTLKKSTGMGRSLYQAACKQTRRAGSRADDQ
jgi:hypothetical protein